MVSEGDKDIGFPVFGMDDDRVYEGVLPMNVESGVLTGIMGRLEGFEDTGNDVSGTVLNLLIDFECIEVGVFMELGFSGVPSGSPQFIFGGVESILAGTDSSTIFGGSDSGNFLTTDGASFSTGGGFHSLGVPLR
jgi:hypothetical protein